MYRLGAGERDAVTSYMTNITLLQGRSRALPSFDLFRVCTTRPYENIIPTRDMTLQSRTKKYPCYEVQTVDSNYVIEIKRKFDGNAVGARKGLIAFIKQFFNL